MAQHVKAFAVQVQLEGHPNPHECHLCMGAYHPSRQEAEMEARHT